jgi:peroxiredoxin
VYDSLSLSLSFNSVVETLLTWLLQVRFLGDPSGKFTEALDLSFDSSAIFGNNRSKRYALLIENGKVKEAFVEPDNTGVNGMSLVDRVYRPLLTSLSFHR